MIPVVAFGGLLVFTVLWALSAPVGPSGGRTKRQPPTKVSKPEDQTAIELRRIRRQLDLAELKREIRSDARQFRREIERDLAALSRSRRWR